MVGGSAPGSSSSSSSSSELLPCGSVLLAPSTGLAFSALRGALTTLLDAMHDPVLLEEVRVATPARTRARARAHARSHARTLTRTSWHSE
jgi:hypothetical protein